MTLAKTRVTLITFMFFFQCSDIINPGIQRREIKNVPVGKLLFKTPRRYVTRGDSLELRLEGIQISFVCTEITHLEIIKNDSNYLQPLVEITLPATIDECPLVEESGIDTLLKISLSEFETTDTVLNLVNSSGAEPDSAILIDFPHSDSNLFFAISDTTITDSILADTLFLITDSIFLPCNEKLSFGGYCMNESRDSVMLRLVTTVGWAEDSCSSGILLDVNDEYFKIISPPTTETCLTSLDNM